MRRDRAECVGDAVGELVDHVEYHPVHQVFVCSCVCGKDFSVDTSRRECVGLLGVHGTLVEGYSEKW